MTRYYIRVVTIILFVLVASAIALISVARTVSDRYVKPRAIIEMNALAVRLQTLLGDKTLPEAEEELHNLESRLNFTARLVPLADLQSELRQDSEVAGSGDGLEPAPRIFVQLGKEPFVLELRHEQGLLKQLEEEEGIYFVAGLGVVMVIVICAGYLLVRPLVKKLRAQEQTIARIADGDLTARTAVTGSDAIARLGQRINVMADRIQELLANQRQLLQAVSHEMRTPAARIGFALEMLEDAKTEEERQRRIVALQRDLEDLDNLLDELLTFLRFDENEKLHLESCDLKPLVKVAVDKAARLQRGVSVSYIPPTSRATAVLSQRYFPRVIDNVLANAIRHAKTAVTVHLSADNNICRIEVEDDGPGIPAEDRERIFEPFIRLDQSRSQKSGGTGLGLAIARRVMTRLHGAISVEDSSNGSGVRFRIELRREDC